MKQATNYRYKFLTRKALSAIRAALIMGLLSGTIGNGLSSNTFGLANDVSEVQLFDNATNDVGEPAPVGVTSDSWRQGFDKTIADEITDRSILELIEKIKQAENSADKKIAVSDLIGVFPNLFRIADYKYCSKHPDCKELGIADHMCNSTIAAIDKLFKSSSISNNDEAKFALLLLGNECLLTEVSGVGEYTSFKINYLVYGVGISEIGEDKINQVLNNNLAREAVTLEDFVNSLFNLVVEDINKLENNEDKIKKITKHIINCFKANEEIRAAYAFGKKIDSLERMANYQPCLTFIKDRLDVKEEEISKTKLFIERVLEYYCSSGFGQRISDLPYGVRELIVPHIVMVLCALPGKPPYYKEWELLCELFDMVVKKIDTIAVRDVLDLIKHQEYTTIQKLQKQWKEAVIICERRTFCTREDRKRKESTFLRDAIAEINKISPVLQLSYVDDIEPQ